MAEYEDLNITDASNIARFPENMAPSLVNDGARALEGLVARQRADNNGSLDAGGTANAITLASNKTLSAYVDGHTFIFTATADNTDKVTVDVDSIGARDLLLSDQSMLAPKALVANGVYQAVYKETEDCLYLLNPSNGTMPRNGIDGLTISNNGTDSDHDIDIAVGMARDATNELTIPLNAVLTKQIDATWTVGDDVGGRPAAVSLSADTWYHLFIIFNGSTTDPIVDAGFDTSLMASNLLSASSYTHYRRIGSVLTDSSSNIKAFFQRPRGHFVWDVPVADINASNPGTAAVTATLSTPTDVKTLADLHISVLDTVVTAAGDDYAMFVSDLDMTDTTAFPVGANHAYGIAAVTSGNASATGNVHVWTNTSSQVRYRISRSDGSIAARINTHGWFDPRGTDG
ncbi:MAG: hypothetical protein ACR2RF_24795 [Geminicoccaceae bacterium]